MTEQKIELKMIRMSEVQSQEIEWLWYPFIPYGKLTIIQGDPGDGKTTMVLNLAAKLSKGEALDENMKVTEPVNVIYQTAEDGLADTVKPRLELAGADCERIIVIDESDKSLSMVDERLEEAIVRTGARLLILDPIQAYLGGGMDMNRANEARDMTKKLGALAEKNDCIFALVESAKLLMKEGNFSEAIKYWKKALEKNPTEPYYIQQLALCTYKQKVSKEEQEMYLNDALRILERLADSNDPETFGLKGAIYKRLSKINNDNIGYLNRAIEYYEKGYMISYDFYTGENLAFCFDKKSTLLNDGEDEKIYCRIQAKKIREQLYKILSSKMELEDITNIPNVKWMSATFSICCYALGKQEEGRKYEKLFKDMAEQWEKDTYNFQKEELKQLINIEVN